MHEIKKEERTTERVVSKTAVIKTIYRCPQWFQKSVNKTYENMN